MACGRWALLLVQQSWLTEADRWLKEGVKDAKGKARTKHILKLRMRPRARAPVPGPGPACACLCSSSVGPAPWPVWGKEGQSGWEGQSKRGTGWTRGGGGLSKWCAG